MASPQRLEIFLNIQTAQGVKKPIGMVRDVRTRWGSTVRMLQRACRKRHIIKEWLKHPKNVNLQYLYPTSDEWKQVEYVITILHPFHKYTYLLSNTSDTTIDLAWSIYNNLFDHLEDIKQKLERKR